MSPFQGLDQVDPVPRVPEPAGAGTSTLGFAVPPFQGWHQTQPRDRLIAPWIAFAISVFRAGIRASLIPMLKFLSQASPFPSPWTWTLTWTSTCTVFLVLRD